MKVSPLLRQSPSWYEDEYTIQQLFFKEKQGELNTQENKIEIARLYIKYQERPYAQEVVGYLHSLIESLGHTKITLFQETRQIYNSDNSNIIDNKKDDWI